MIAEKFINPCHRPVRLKLSRASGFNLQLVSVSTNGRAAAKVDRSSDFGNPYRIGDTLDFSVARKWGWTLRSRIVCATAEEAVRRFARDLLWDQAVHARVRAELGGKNLACWCEIGDPCHGHPLIFIANSTEEQINRIHAMIDDRLFTEAEAIIEGVNAHAL